MREDRGAIVRIDCATLAQVLGMPDGWRIHGAVWRIEDDAITLRISGPDLPNSHPIPIPLKPALKPRIELDWSLR